MSVQQRKILALKNPFGGETAILRVSAEQIKLDLIKEQNENLTLLVLKNDKALGIFYGETSGSSVIFSRESLETVGDFQIENEFAALVINGGAKPLFFADCRKNAGSNPPEKTIGGILSLYEKNYTKTRVRGEQEKAGVLRENPGSRREREPYSPEYYTENGGYDDEALATENYYEKSKLGDITAESRNESEKRQGENHELSHNQNESFIEPPNRENAQETIRNGFCENEIGTGNGAARPTFYQSIKEKLEKALDEHPAEPAPAEIVPESRWARINYSGDKCYILGVICENGTPRHVVYGVPGEKTCPPHGFERYSEFIPKSLFYPDGDGYWCLFQNAETGETENKRR